MSGHKVQCPTSSSLPCLAREESEPVCPVGSTDVASMWKGKRMDKTSTRSAENLILTITRRSCRGLGASASIVQIVESLVWPFVARRSLRRDDWFSDKELNRFVRSMQKTAMNLIKYSSEDNREQTFMKFWLDSLLCGVFLDSQLPIKEDWIQDPLFVGWCKRFCARAIAKRDVSFIYSLQKGSKRAWPKLGDVKEAAALKKHAERLSQFHGYIPDDLHEMINFTSKEVFKNCNRAGTKFMPSGSACLQAARRKGGALSLVDRFTLPLNTKESSAIGKLPVLAAGINGWRKEQFASVYDEAVRRLTVHDEDGYLPALDVDVVAIPEPGKFRIITKGDGYLYSALQPVQGVLLDAWKRHSASTMLRNDLTERVNEIDKVVKLKFWCSVDYEAATDLLKKDASMAALRPLYDLIFSDIAWLSLFPGRARYPDGTVVDAIEGQLMGHPLSFPFLCVINLAVYRLALERWMDGDRKGRQVIGDIMWGNVLVNGDDMLFKCDESFYPIFLKTAADAGFKISAGKNYLSPDCCMINSQVFRRVKNSMKRCGYLNLKLVSGVSLKTGESESTPTQVGKDLGEMVKLCPWSACSIPTAFGRWGQDWFGPIYRPNWYLPVHLGGFGVPRELAPITWRVTRAQRLVAAKFVSDPRLALYRRKGMDIPSVQLAGALAKWRMVPGDYVHEESESSDLRDSWLERLAYAARACHGSVEVSDKVFIAKFFGEYRLKPMSMEGIERYWSAQVFATRLPPCPPIGLIKVRSLTDF